MPRGARRGRPTRVFLSYSHDSEAHREAVRELAGRLRRDGIESWLDQYLVAPPEGWLRWMQDQIEKADFVLLVCTSTYRRRFDGKEPWTGHGATYEALLAAQMLYDAGMRNEKLIPLLPDGEPDDSIPLSLRPFARYRVPSQYEGLLRHLAGQPEVVAPPVAKGRDRRRKPPAASPLAIPRARSRGAGGVLPNALQILIVDDLAEWREAAREALQELGEDVVMDLAADPGQAHRLLATRCYDLVVMDVALRGDPEGPSPADERGFDLLAEMRRGGPNRSCAVIVLTGHASGNRYQRAFKELKVHAVIEKLDYDDPALTAAAREAILKARLGTAAEPARHSSLIVSLEEEHLLGSRLERPRERSAYDADPPIPVDWRQLAERSEALKEAALRSDAARWRQEAHRLASDLRRHLVADERIFDHPLAKLDLDPSPAPLWLRFRGPASTLGISFELLADREPLCLHSLVTREIELPSHASRKLETLAQLVERLRSDGEELRILLMTAGGESDALAAEREVGELKSQIERDLRQLGLAHRVSALAGARATRALVEDALRGGYHILHVAGPGRGERPPPGGLPLRRGAGTEILPAAALQQLVERTPLALLFLNGCVGTGRSEQGQEGGGTFAEILAALARADVPTVLGLRWPIPEQRAVLLASTFYRHLWRSFSPAESLLAARIACSQAEEAEEMSFASPVLLMQGS